MITTATTVTTIPAADATALGAVGTLSLICLLIVNGLSDSLDDGVRSQKLARNTVLGVTFFSFAFAMIVVVKIMEIL